MSRRGQVLVELSHPSQDKSERLAEMSFCFDIATVSYPITLSLDFFYIKTFSICLKFLFLLNMSRPRFAHCLSNDLIAGKKA